jgi:hypothetical protein
VSACLHAPSEEALACFDVSTPLLPSTAACLFRFAILHVRVALKAMTDAYPSHSFVLLPLSLVHLRLAYPSDADLSSTPPARTRGEPPQHKSWNTAQCLLQLKPPLRQRPRLLPSVPPYRSSLHPASQSPLAHRMVANRDGQ